MKKTLGLILLLLSFFVLSSCTFDNRPDPDIQGSGASSRIVTFVVDGEETTKSFSGAITYPNIPDKDNYIFSGWYYDEAGERPAYLGTSTDTSIKLYAVWRYDYESALEIIFSEHIKAAVGITVEHRKTGFSFSVATQVVSGSGVIFDEDINYYYILSNNHVTEAQSGFSSRTISVIDCYGKEHNATLLAAEAEYDLSLIRIPKTETPLEKLSFADKSPGIGDVVAAIGQPGGIDNSVTFGEMTKLEMLSGDNPKEALPFPVIWHDASVDHGSSGGVLLNGNFEIIGINYAVGTSKTDGKFLCGLAVPLDKVREFVEKYKAE